MLPLGEAFGTPNDGPDPDVAFEADAMRASPELVLSTLLVETSVLLVLVPSLEPPQAASANVSVSAVAARRRAGSPKYFVLIMSLASLRKVKNLARPSARSRAGK
jgi:hypothetical protein